MLASWQVQGPSRTGPPAPPTVPCRQVWTVAPRRISHRASRRSVAEAMRGALRTRPIDPPRTPRSVQTCAETIGSVRTPRPSTLRRRPGSCLDWTGAHLWEAQCRGSRPAKPGDGCRGERSGGGRWGTRSPEDVGRQESTGLDVAFGHRRVNHTLHLMWGLIALRTSSGRT